MAIMTQSRLKKQGHMFHPDYQESDGIYSDNEFTERAYAEQAVVEARHIQFKHENPMFAGGNPDEQLKTTTSRSSMRKAKLSMKNAKQIIGCRKAKKGEDTKGLGMIKIRQVSPRPHQVCESGHYLR
jgi:hypothetical protein